MQLQINKKYIRYLLLLGKGFIVFSVFFYLYEGVFVKGTIPESWVNDLWTAFRNGESWLIAAAAGLILINWGLEALKWQKLAGKVEAITLLKAFRAVLTGIALGFVTPNRVGDYAGRILELQSQKRLEAVGAVFLGRFCQLLITLTAGSIGVFYFFLREHHLNLNLIAGFVCSLIVVNASFYLPLFRPAIILNFVSHLPFIKQVAPYISILASYSVAEIKTLLVLSFFRYTVFVAQFMLLLFAFGVEAQPWQMALAVSGTFLLKSIVPSLTALTDLGMRELSALYFFGLLNQANVLVLSASLSLWFLNIGLPSLTGLLFVWGLKLKVTKEAKVLK
ncbi:lysylphosphatidylglycerol synthase domain-containing protein [Adhaeribacter aquaticus]|uniref:lysylphosphatidylglycerol synthase domain-containing protein n=1 Tax=Adhaeribacter aquaticus TaxID=299567 RepID=UPI00047A9A51|nr:lysylphosphatidylglycerol synthase domain-containing protein [Adhaeribacter aquaticus]